MSIVTLSAAEAALTLPAASVAVAVKLCAPSARVAVVKVQAPLPFAVAVPSSVAPSIDLHRAAGLRPCRSRSACCRW